MTIETLQAIAFLLIVADLGIMHFRIQALEKDVRAINRELWGVSE